MTSPWTVASLAGSHAASARETILSLEKAHDAVVSDNRERPQVRQLVQESWARSLSLQIDPSGPAAEPDLSFDELRMLRNRHPLASVLPVVHNLLIRHAFDSGLIVAIGDETGRLLWIDGDRVLRNKAEDMLFVEGADWSERRVGTSAPGTALALDHGIQIQRAEHFNRLAHPWSCTAVPIHDPHTGLVLGVIDITGGDDAVAPQTLPLVEAAVAAMEAELRILRLDSPSRTPSVQRSVLLPVRQKATPPMPEEPLAARQLPAQLEVLGRDHGTLHCAGVTVELSPRHAEILALLSWHRSGLSAEKLALLLNDDQPSVENLRAEMVRLRKALEPFGAAVQVHSRPYRLASSVELDAQRVLAFLDRGAHRVALGAYAGAVLPASSAPGVLEMRAEVSARLREALLSDAKVELLLDYALLDETVDDSEVLRACLQLLAPRSPKRASVISRLTRIENELSADRNFSQPLLS
jgi:hypothetical protein